MHTVKAMTHLNGINAASCGETIPLPGRSGGEACCPDCISLHTSVCPWVGVKKGKGKGNSAYLVWVAVPMMHGQRSP